MGVSSLSTMWGVGRFEKAAEFVSAARHLGFQGIELNPQVSSQMLEEILALRDARSVEISSVHAPCPKWAGPVPELSAIDEGERVAAVGIIKGAVDLARRVGAPRVVVHAGRVNVNTENEQTLRRLCEQGEKGTPAYERVMHELIREREDRRHVHMEATARSLREVQEYARGTGVKLGLENRYHYYEVPLLGEAQALLASLDAAVFHYWHDAGHAHSLEVLGFQPHEEWLRLLGSRILGMHLHDAVGTGDHRPVGTGDINFEMLRQYLPGEAVRVCEFNSSWPYEEVQAAFGRLKKLGFF